MVSPSSSSFLLATHTRKVVTLDLATRALPPTAWEDGVIPRQRGPSAQREGFVEEKQMQSHDLAVWMGVEHVPQLLRRAGFVFEPPPAEYCIAHTLQYCGGSVVAVYKPSHLAACFVTGDIPTGLSQNQLFFLRGSERRGGVYLYNVIRLCALILPLPLPLPFPSPQPAPGIAGCRLQIGGG